MRADNEQVFGNIECLKDDPKPRQLSESNHSSEADAMNGDGKEVRDGLLPGKGDSLEKEGSVFYMDKSVTACDLPEIVVCYKENTYHVVKDICVDEGVPVQGQLLPNENGFRKCVSDQFGSEDPTEAEVTATVVGTLESGSICIGPVKVEEHSQCCSASKPGSESVTTHRNVIDARDKTSERVVDTPEIQDADAEESRKSNLEDLIVPTLDSSEISPAKEDVKAAGIATKESLTLADVMSMEDGKKPFNHRHDGPDEQSSQEPSEKRRSTERSALAPEVVEAEDSKTFEVSPITAPEEAYGTEKAKSNTENSNAVASDLSSVPTSQEPTRASDSESGLRTGEPQRPEHDVPRHIHVLEDPYELPFPSGFGETSFSAAEPVSGHITYSGPIAFSGSLSVRSDASTTSTRSFAFPVLQAEWNSSPVRMAKADKRHLRNQKSWTHSLLCCRF